ncbi:hypothetical protein [Nocardia sp. NPDC057668]|uniref:hypothetical protein n=1 Tax=Nocardia sp. NPDC057668 TaxID=3346202 RepID=UPI003671ABC8
MSRLLVLVTVLLCTAVACGDDAKQGAKSNAAAPPGDSRSETIGWARAVDPCALLDAGELRELGPEVTVGTSSMTTNCSAVVTGGPDQRIDVDVRIGFAPQLETFKYGSMIEVQDRKVHRVDIRETVPAEQRDQLVQTECDYRIPLDGGLGVTVSVEMDRAADPCATGDKLIPGVIKQWNDHPAQGTSPATTVTVLSALTSPCVGLEKLQATRKVEFDWQEQTLDSCYLTVDGASTLISLENRERDLITLDKQEVRLGDYVGYRSEHQGDTFIDVIVGEEFPGVWGNRSIRQLPIVGVMSNNPDVAQAVAENALAHLPK